LIVITNKDKVQKLYGTQKILTEFALKMPTSLGLTPQMGCCFITQNSITI
jgi:hypothetical protein